MAQHRGAGDLPAYPTHQLLPRSQALWQGRPSLPTSAQAGPVDPQTQSCGTFGQKLPQPQAGFGPPASSGPSLLSSLPPKLLVQAHSSSRERAATVPSALRKKCPPVVSRSPLIRAPTPCRRCRPAVQAGVSRSALLTPGLLVWRLLEGGSPRGSPWLHVPVPAGPWAGWQARHEEPRRRPGPASPRGCL